MPVPQYRPKQAIIRSNIVRSSLFHHGIQYHIAQTGNHTEKQRQQRLPFFVIKSRHRPNTPSRNGLKNHPWCFRAPPKNCHRKQQPEAFSAFLSYRSRSASMCSSRNMAGTTIAHRSAFPCLVRLIKNVSAVYADTLPHKISTSAKSGMPAVFPVFPKQPVSQQTVNAVGKGQKDKRHQGMGKTAG